MTYTIRNVDEKTKEALGRYADEHRITIGEAMQQLVDFGLEHYEQHKKVQKKYAGARDALGNLPRW